tara:strand:+ start:4505 stop:5251 length:747 start_codon:yes stop_codon:yes gene_type:complete
MKTKNPEITNKTTYFYHMMKTGGRSVYGSFAHYLSNTKCGDANGCSVTSCEYPNSSCLLARQAINGQFQENYPSVGKLFSGGHTPFWHEGGRVRQYDYTITVIRDPLSRLLSHYRMLQQIYQFDQRSENNDPSDDPKWVINGFDYFIKKFPKEFRLHQLHFFSPSYNVDEAFDNITKCSQIIRTENQQEGFDQFALKSRIQLTEIVSGATAIKEHDLSADQVEKLREILEPEYDFYEKVIKYYNRTYI